ncbi:MAG: response regulator [Desulfobacterales bacterium]|jgi:twitching motility two-component system response regulator PilH
MPKKVLIVDDDPDVRLFNSSVVQELGYIPIEASDGEEGQQMVAREKPDLIILDVMMPLQSGIRLYRALKTDRAFADIPIIILSGITKRSFMKSQEALTAFGGSDIPAPEAYIEKPADFETLSMHIEKRIRRE